MKKTLLLSLLLISVISGISQIQDGLLYDACESGDYDIVKQYINEGGDINIDFENGETPLMTACRFNHPEIIKLLAGSGANLNLVNLNGMTAMTILRLQMGYNDTFNSEPQTNLRKMYAYLKSKGGKEKDFVQWIAENESGKYEEEQKTVLGIKKDFKEYMANSKNLKTKTYNEEKHEGDDISFTDTKNYYTAKYDQTGQLVYFQHKYETVAEWHDNGQRNGFDTQYYFKNGKLYFYFDTNYTGAYELDYNQFRYYFKDGKIIVAALKNYDEWWENMKNDDEKFNFNTIVNIKDTETYRYINDRSELIYEEFENDYNNIKDLLK